MLHLQHSFSAGTWTNKRINHKDELGGDALKICDFNGEKNISGDRFVTDYELMMFAKVLGVSMEWLTDAGAGMYEKHTCVPFRRHRKNLEKSGLSARLFL